MYWALKAPVIALHGHYTTLSPIHSLFFSIHKRALSLSVRPKIHFKSDGLFIVGFIVQCLGKQFHWMSFIHSVHLQHTRKFSVGSGCVSKPHGWAKDPDRISNMPSIRSSWPGERTQRLDNEPLTSNTSKHSCAFRQVLWSCCRMVHLLLFFFHSLIHL